MKLLYQTTTFVLLLCLTGTAQATDILNGQYQATFKQKSITRGKSLCIADTSYQTAPVAVILKKKSLTLNEFNLRRVKKRLYKGTVRVAGLSGEKRKAQRWKVRKTKSGFKVKIIEKVKLGKKNRCVFRTNGRLTTI